MRIVFLGVQTPEQQETILADFNTVCHEVKVTNLDELVVLCARLGEDTITNCLSTKRSDLERMAKNLEKIHSHRAFLYLKPVSLILRTAPYFLYLDILKRNSNIRMPNS